MRTIDLKPHIGAVEVLASGVPMALGTTEDQAVLSVRLNVVEGRGCKPSEVVDLLGLELSRVRVIRLHARLAHPTTGENLAPERRSVSDLSALVASPA